MTFFQKLGVTLTLVLGAATAQAQTSIEKAQFPVSGVCDMCQYRIETAAKLKGVKMATWDRNSQSITVYFKGKKVELKQIQQAILAAGHDAAGQSAPDSVYLQLPDCCAYRDGVEVH